MVAAVERRMRRVLGGMLADFSPIPGTKDGDICAEYVDKKKRSRPSSRYDPANILIAKSISAGSTTSNIDLDC